MSALNAIRHGYSTNSRSSITSSLHGHELWRSGKWQAGFSSGLDPVIHQMGGVMRYLIIIHVDFVIQRWQLEQLLT
jgi:hypothetical protein